MYQKRGQITVYVIIAILIVSSMIIVYSFRERLGIGNIQKSVDPEAKPINDQVLDCLKTTSTNGIVLIGLQGGYVNPPSTSLQSNLSTIAYGFYAGKRILPTKTGVEKQLNDYISSALPKCTDFSKFSGYEIKSGKVISDARIRDNYTDIIVQWPITITKGNSIMRLNDFEGRVDIRLGMIHRMAEVIVNQAVYAPKGINVSYFVDQEKNNGFKTDIISDNKNNNSLIYALKDQSQASYLNYTLFIAMKY